MSRGVAVWQEIFGENVVLEIVGQMRYNKQKQPQRRF